MIPEDRIYDSRNVANFVLELADTMGRAFVPAQVIKLVYLCHGWSLRLLHQPLIFDDVEAWRVGPIIRRLHRELGEFQTSSTST